MDLLRHLEFFTTVSQTRHFGDAARDLGMTQPPLSQGVQRLERRLGVRLFDRDARGVRLTDDGTRLLPLARDLLDRSERFLVTAQETQGPGRVRIGLAGDLDELCPVLLSGLAAVGVPVIPTVAGSVELTDGVRDGELDLAVTRHPGVIDGLSAGKVLRVPQRLYPTGGADLRGAGLPLATAPRHHQPPAHDQLIDELRRLGHSGDVIEAAGVAQRAALVASGMAIRLVPDVHSRESVPPLRLRVVWPRGRSRREGVDHPALADLLQELL